MKKPHAPIHNLGKFAHPPKSNVNWSGPVKAQVAPEPKLIRTAAKGAHHGRHGK